MIGIGLTFLLYRACLNGGFLWDDKYLVTKNSFIRSPRLIAEAFRHFLAEDPPSNFYRPVQTLSYIWDYWRGGMNPDVFRETNYVIHGLNGGLFFLLLHFILKRETQLTRRRIFAVAFLICMVWLVHPVHSAAVAYISGRADSLALMFLLLGWCFWEKRKNSSGHYKWVWIPLVTTSGLLAICSKEAALMGVGFFLFSECFLHTNSSPREKRSIFLSGIFLGLIYWILRQSAASISETVNHPQSWSERPSLILRALGDYLRLLLFPSNLRMERQVVQVSYLNVNPKTFDPIYPWLGFLGAFFLGALLITIFHKGRYVSLRRFGAIWFIFTIFPVSNVFALNATVAEHWLYLPSIGFFIALVGWWLEADNKVQNLTLYIGWLAVVALGVRTTSRAKDWTDAVTFFQATIRDGGDTPRMRVNLADEYRSQGHLAKGEKLLREVLQRDPGYSQARHSLMVNLLAQRRAEEAEQIAGDPDSFGSSFRGKLYAADTLLRRGKLVTCAERLRQLRAIYPDSWLLTVEIAAWLDKSNNPEEKIELIENFAHNHWWHLASHHELANLYARDPQRQSDAIETYLAAADLDVRDSENLYRASVILAQKGAFSEAIILQKKSLKHAVDPVQLEWLRTLEKAETQ